MIQLNRLPFRLYHLQKYKSRQNSATMYSRRPAGVKQQSPGLLHLLFSNPLFANTIPTKNATQTGGIFDGGLEGIRTLDPHNANVVRSQLRYKPM